MENLCLQRLDNLILGKIPNPKDRTLFRIIYKGDFKKMYINIFDTENKNWEIDKKLAIHDYLKNQITEQHSIGGIINFTNKVFLKRNLSEKRKYGDWICKNRIEYNVIFCFFQFNLFF